MGIEQVVDVGAVIAILGVTPIFKGFVAKRYVPLIPLLLGLVAGLVIYGKEGGFELPLGEAIFGVAWKMLIYAGGASIIYKLKSRVILGK